MHEYQDSIEMHVLVFVHLVGYITETRISERQTKRVYLRGSSVYIET